MFKKFYQGTFFLNIDNHFSNKKPHKNEFSLYLDRKITNPISDTREILANEWTETKGTLERRNY